MPGSILGHLGAVFEMHYCLIDVLAELGIRFRAEHDLPQLSFGPGVFACGRQVVEQPDLSLKQCRSVGRVDQGRSDRHNLVDDPPRHDLVSNESEDRKDHGLLLT